jgi:hypothetical protein
MMRDGRVGRALYILNICSMLVGWVVRLPYHDCDLLPAASQTVTP